MAQTTRGMQTDHRRILLAQRARGRIRRRVGCLILELDRPRETWDDGSLRRWDALVGEADALHGRLHP